MAIDYNKKFFENEPVGRHGEKYARSSHCQGGANVLRLPTVKDIHRFGG
jgi:hypothetical protein